jgi:hypothetical protein
LADHIPIRRRLADLIELVRDGNREAALTQLKSRELDGELLSAGRRLLGETTARRRSVFVPLVDPRADRSYTASISIDTDRSRPPWLGDERAADAVERAMNDAWRDCGATGTRPAAWPRLGIEGAVPELQVTGGSLYLGVYLAARAHFGEQPLPHSVLATGDFAAEPELDAKHALFTRVRRELGLEYLMVASREPLRLPYDSDFRQVGDRPEAARQVFGIEPWHRSANVTSLHIHTSERGQAPAGRFRGRDTRVVFVGWQAPAALPATLASVRQALADSERSEFSFEGPPVVVAALGVDMRNDPRAVRLVATDHVVWHNQVRLFHPRPPERTEARVVIAPDAVAVQEPWKAFRVPANITPSDLPVLVERFLAEHAGTRTLHLVFATWLPVAWSLAGMLKNSGRRIYYQRAGEEPWFESRDGRISFQTPGG